MKRIPEEEMEHVPILNIYEDIHKYFNKKEQKKKEEEMKKKKEEERVRIKYTMFNLNTENIKEAKNEYRINIYDHFVLNDVKRKDYIVQDVFQTEELIHDLMKIFAYIDTARSFYLLKEWDENSNFCNLERVTEANIKAKLKKIKFIIKNNVFDAWEIVSCGTNMEFFQYNQMTFYSENPGYFSRFRGLPYKSLEECDEDVIALFMSHMLNVICNDNEELCTYIINWFAHIFQKPGEKIGIALILVGMQGTGKTVFTNVVCHLCGCYGLENANLNNISGNYNTLIKDKILIVVNEVDPKYGLTSGSTNNLKTLITESSIDFNQKHKDAINGKNFANFIFVSNNFIPMRIDLDDRRFCVIEVSPDYKDDKEYFVSLLQSIEVPGFYENLITFFLSIDIADWNPAEIPYTEAKERIINECNNRKKTEPKNKIGRRELYEQCVEWSKANNRSIPDANLFGRLAQESFKITKSRGKKYYRLVEDSEDSEQEALPPPSPPPLSPPSLPPPPPQKYDEEEDFPFQDIFDQQYQGPFDDDDLFFN